jgi:peptidyl-prolyl cis-trans isomerase SurA
VDDNTRGEAARKVVKIVKIEDVIPQHTMTLESDYDRIKQYALRKKQNEAVEKWVNNKIPSVFISLDKRYKDCNFKSDWKKGAISK